MRPIHRLDMRLVAVTSKPMYFCEYPSRVRYSVPLPGGMSEALFRP